MSSFEPSTEPSPFSERQPHRLRQVAESFGVDAERYDRARPRYPDVLIQRVITASPGVVNTVPGIVSSQSYCLKSVSKSGTSWYLGNSSGGPTTTACTTS